MKHLNYFKESLGNETKVLLISEGDYAHSSFSNKYSGTKVIDIINNIEDYKPDGSDEYEYWELKVLSFNIELDDKFLDFIRDSIMSYDDTKHKYFYIENEIIE